MPWPPQVFPFTPWCFHPEYWVLLCCKHVLLFICWFPTISVLMTIGHGLASLTSFLWIYLFGWSLWLAPTKSRQYLSHLSKSNPSSAFLAATVPSIPKICQLSKSCLNIKFLTILVRNPVCAGHVITPRLQPIKSSCFSLQAWLPGSQS